MKTSDAIAVLKAINAVGDKSVPLKFAYACARNRRPLSDLHGAFEKTRLELVKKFAKKDKDDEPIVKNGKYELTDEAAFDAAYLELAGEDVPIELHKVSLTEFPADVQVDVMEALLPMTMEYEPPAVPKAKAAPALKVVPTKDVPAKVAKRAGKK